VSQGIVLFEAPGRHHQFSEILSLGRDETTILISASWSFFVLLAQEFENGDCCSQRKIKLISN
jgi:cell wall assembly regulator SMI1